MDFYGNHNTIDWQVSERTRELRTEVGRIAQARAAKPADDTSGPGWSTDFAAWVTGKARIGATFMARTPANP